MTQRFNALAHLTVCAVVGLVVAAVLLGRGTSRTGKQTPLSPRHPAHPRYHAFNGYLFPDDRPHKTRLLDTETGEVTLLDFTGDEGFDAISCSPWQDEMGQYHLAGRRSAARVDQPDGLGGETGMGRYTFPGGKVLDRITFDLMPAASPCWFPDGSDRILFAAGDGALYDLPFSGTAGPENAATAIRPRRIRWKTNPPGKGRLYIQDPCWPSEPALGGRLVVSLRYRHASSGSLERLQLWWLQLSPDGTSIVAAGRLRVHSKDESGVTSGEEHHPSIVATPEGALRLAYVIRPAGRYDAELWTAPLTFESRAGDRVPRIQARGAVCLATNCVAAAPAFSADGQSIFAAVREGTNREVHLKRFTVDPDDSRQSLTARSRVPHPAG